MQAEKKVVEGQEWDCGGKIEKKQGMKKDSKKESKGRTAGRQEEKEKDQG